VVLKDEESNKGSDKDQKSKAKGKGDSDLAREQSSDANFEEQEDSWIGEKKEVDEEEVLQMMRYEETKEGVTNEDMFTDFKITKDKYIAKTGLVLDYSKLLQLENMQKQDG